MKALSAGVAESFPRKGMPKRSPAGPRAATNPRRGWGSGARWRWQRQPRAAVQRKRVQYMATVQRMQDQYRAAVQRRWEQYMTAVQPRRYLAGSFRLKLRPTMSMPCPRSKQPGGEPPS